MTIRVTKARRGFRATANTGEWAIGPTLGAVVNKFADEFGDILRTNGIDTLTFVVNTNDL